MNNPGKVIAEVQNMPEHTDQYIVARFNLGEFWYWCDFDNLSAAKRSAETFDNGVVFERYAE